MSGCKHTFVSMHLHVEACVCEHVSKKAFFSSERYKFKIRHSDRNSGRESVSVSAGERK